ncbi:MAG: ABC transporter substrate-binding protein [Rhodospirillales bacterium]|nr:ABC transporter substrate-binding protein [Rhodospirillales bacterium]
MLRKTVLTILLTIGMATTAQANLEDDASAFIADHGNKMIEILGLPHGQDRRDTFEAWLTEAFDLDKLAELALGPYRKTVTEGQMAAYDEAFAHYIVRTYEARLDGFTGYDFSVMGTRPMNVTDAVVRTNIVSPEGDVYVVDFRIEKGDDEQLHVIDVAIEGLSMLKTQREEFSAVIQRDGIDGLISSLNERADAIASAE